MRRCSSVGTRRLDASYTAPTRGFISASRLRSCSSRLVAEHVCAALGRPLRRRSFVVCGHMYRPPRDVGRCVSGEWVGGWKTAARAHAWVRCAAYTHEQTSSRPGGPCVSGVPLSREVCVADAVRGRCVRAQLRRQARPTRRTSYYVGREARQRPDDVEHHLKWCLLGRGTRGGTYDMGGGGKRLRTIHSAQSDRCGPHLAVKYSPLNPREDAVLPDPSTFHPSGRSPPCRKSEFHRASRMPSAAFSLRGTSYP